MRHRFSSVHESKEETPPPPDRRQNRKHQTRGSRKQDSDSISAEERSTKQSKGRPRWSHRLHLDAESAEPDEKPKRGERRVAKHPDSHRSVSPTMQKRRGRSKKQLQVKEITERCEVESEIGAAKKGETEKRQNSKQNNKHIPTETAFDLENEGVPAKRAKKPKAPTSETSERWYISTSADALIPNHSSSDLKDTAGRKKIKNSDQNFGSSPDLEDDSSRDSSKSELWDELVDSNDEVELSSVKHNAKKFRQSRKSKQRSKDSSSSSELEDTGKLPVKRRIKNTPKRRKNASPNFDLLSWPLGGFSAIPLTNEKEKGQGKRRKKEPTQCKECGRLVKGRVAMERHMLTHTGEKPFECGDCGRRYSNSSNLRIHQQIHTGKMDYSCEQCGQKFTHLSYLKVHVLRHTGKRPHTCDQCGKGFVQKYHLKRHLLVHLDKIPYTCDKCDATFNRTDCLSLHMRNVHLSKCDGIEPIKPFKCDMCEKAFTNRTSLKIHHRVHTGVTPFSCSICQRKFKQSSQMHSHMRTHSGEKPYACDVCGMRFLRKNYIRVHKEKKHLSKSSY